jgi:(1->4)-alpha-D-glucan 1-alpha-D-glucosylmutase
VNLPRATMRLQFHRGFAFADACSLAPYFASLGISHIYASPIMTARPGSPHGYDVVDPTRVNPELGGEAELLRLVEELRRHDLGLIVDIVPNHMAVGSGNRWWMDVLARGRDSRYAKYFDIDWNPPNSDLRGKLLLPVLGRPYGEALESGEITLARGDDASVFMVRYFDHVFPIAAGNLAADTALDGFDPAVSQGRARLHELLERQHYRLAWWRVANDEINWRRFFDINELAALRIENDEVFEAVHATVLRLYADGVVDGLRIDHIDGLSQPEAYCRKLRARLSALDEKRPVHAPPGPAYLVVEKILARDEALPKTWLTDGTTGYDFMNQVSALQHDLAGERSLTELWHRVSGRPADFDSEEELARRQILERSFSAQRDSVVESLYAIAQSSLVTRDCSRAAIRRVLTEILAHFPVYRIYARVDHVSPSDRAVLGQAVGRARQTCLPGDKWLVTRLGEWFSGERLALDALQNGALVRFQQLSAPLCAKAVEDTAFYRYGRLISRNDVGFDARQFACSADEFHRKMKARVTDFPHTMLATATHDHKRGEDVRARLAVLSELPQEWSRAVERWIALAAAHCQSDGTGLMPSPGDLAIAFQTIVGAWPLDLRLGDRPGLDAYCQRILAWQEKALREAKLHSDWSEPSEAYERAAAEFVTWLFGGRSLLLEDIEAFARRIAPAGAANGLAQVVLKLTAPGVPDIYQGTEYWDLSLVDPDNRARVDFTVRQKSQDAALSDDLAAHWPDGRIKQFLIKRVLALRNEMPVLFSEGIYQPLEIAGPMAPHVVAFARLREDSAAIIAFCRFNARFLAADDQRALPFLQCTNTEIHIPAECCGIYSDVVQGTTLSMQHVIKAGAILGALPVAVLTRCGLKLPSKSLPTACA